MLTSFTLRKVLLPLENMAFNGTYVISDLIINNLFCCCLFVVWCSSLLKLSAFSSKDAGDNIQYILYEIISETNVNFASILSIGIYQNLLDRNFVRKWKKTTCSF